jgi:hypothetical protein
MSVCAHDIEHCARCAAASDEAFAKLRKRLALLREALRRSAADAALCPLCDRHSGHAPDCELATNAREEP